MLTSHSYLKTKALSWFARFIQIQLLVTIISLPMLAAWGMPISLLTPLGNLIFTPFLAAFLALSCFVFFFELVHIPNNWLVSALEALTTKWLYLIHLADKKWLVGFPAAAWYILGAIPIIACIALQWRNINTPVRSICCLSVLLFFSSFVLKVFCTPQTLVSHIPCNNGHVTVVKKNQHVALIDPGYIGQRISAPSWIEYTLRSELIKKTGSPALDVFVVLRPNKLTFEAIEHVCSKLRVHTVYLIMWQGMLTAKEWRAFAHMKKILAEKNVTLRRIPFWQQTRVPLDTHVEFLITPTEQMISQTDIVYPACSVTWRVDKEQVTIYSAKHKKFLNHKEKNAL